MNSLTRHCSLAPLRTPPIHRSMRTLDRAQFVKVVPCLALKVPAPKANTAMKALGPYLLNWPRMKNLVGEGKERLVLLDAAPETDLGEIQGLDSVLETALSGVPVEKTSFEVKVGYEYWTADEILKAVLPEDIEVITAFETIGDIAHMNLRDHVLPYKHLIGQVILDKTARLTTVVNKTSSIHTQFRTFPLELLASRNPAHTPTSLETTLSENGCQYHLNFATVYWNSRLHTEHHRLVHKYFSPGDLVADAMCGIGPFALPAAKNKGCAVVANDLNPESYRWLVKNVEINGLAGTSAAAGEGDRPPAGYVKPVNECGRDFIRTSTSRLATLLASEIVPTFERMAAAEQQRADSKQSKGKDPASHLALVKQYQASIAKWTDKEVPVHVFAHYVMNLPASALGFLDGFLGMWAEHAEHRAYLRTVRPMVHVYYFTRAGFVGRTDGESEEAAIHRDAKARIAYVMGAEPEELEVHRVRLVAPRKDMCCASFRVPESVLFGETVGGDVKVELEYDLHEEEGEGEGDSDESVGGKKRGRREVDSEGEAEGAAEGAKKAKVDE
ncbi:Met-10+ like-protein-domain-containing protein [Catenaria anguillulae PL171]|uniref:tRNA (guanine(37)-N1)-methyltransferase n=1 Tax=Catenaria anguillulae PL171 TaxID=765915 RepID=A0A1Y2HTV2_9FUNG|nr:Met-10+ like-protein-domain-containing protein [Catenaria anguillulae PL171]